MDTRTEMAVECGLMLLLLGAAKADNADDWDEEALSLVWNWLPDEIADWGWSGVKQVFLLALDLPAVYQMEDNQLEVEALRARCAVKARNWSTAKLAAELATVTAKVEAVDLAAYRQQKAEAALAIIEARLVMEDESESPIPQFGVAASYLLNSELTRTSQEVFSAKENTKPLAGKLAVYAKEEDAGQWKLIEVVDVANEGREYGHYDMVVPYHHGGWDYSQWFFAPAWNGYSRKAAMAECMA